MHYARFKMTTVLAGLAIALTGCQGLSKSAPPSPSAVVSSLAREGRTGDAIAYAAGTADAAPSLRQEMKEKINAIPNYNDVSLKYLDQQIAESKSMTDLNVAYDRVRTFSKIGVISDEQKTQITQQIQKDLSIKITSNQIVVDLSDYTDDNSVIFTSETRKAAFDRTIDLLSTGAAFPWRQRALSGAFKMASESGPSTYYDSRIRENFDRMKIRRSEIDDVNKYYPDLAGRRSAEISVAANLAIDPEDRLFYEDLKSELKNIKGLELANQPAPLSIIIKKLAYQESTQPERTETVIYADYQVNILAAALLMPRGASYIYDYKIGGAKIEYAYEIIATKQGKQIFNELLRGSEGRAYANCSNARIQNVYGGVQPATFLANDDMAARCGNNTASVDINSVRTEVIKAVAAKIRSIPDIRSAVWAD